MQEEIKVGDKVKIINMPIGLDDKYKLHEICEVTELLDTTGNYDLRLRRTATNDSWYFNFSDVELVVPERELVPGDMVLIKSPFPEYTHEDFKVNQLYEVASSADSDGDYKVYIADKSNWYFINNKNLIHEDDILPKAT